MKKLANLLLVILVFSAFVQAQAIDEKIKEIDAYANTVMDTWHGPGMAIAIVKDDKVVFQKGYGVRELGKPDPVDETALAGQQGVARAPRRRGGAIRAWPCCVASA